MSNASKDSKLQAVTFARENLRQMKQNLEEELRRELQEKLAHAQVLVDNAVRAAFDSGIRKAEILRAMGTRDFRTMQDCLDRTESIAGVASSSSLDSTYSYDPEAKILSVNYVNHGPNDITNKARFEVKRNEDDNQIFFDSLDSKYYGDNYASINHAVVWLDRKLEGFYYEEALEWLHERL